MKSTGPKLILLLLVSPLFPTLHSFAQASFEDLNFEAATNLPSTTSPTQVPVSNALPGWTVYDAGGSPDSQVFYDGVSAGSALVTLVGTNPGGAFAVPALAGNYSATLDGGETGTGLGPAVIAQTGVVPPSTSALLFLAYGDVNGFLTVTVGGQNIPFIPIEAGPNNSELYGGNISAFSGLTEQLSFAETPTASDHFPIAYLDNIQFSNQQIPEPQTWTLLLCGAGALSLWRRKQRQ
jgi:hypothetical protein